MKKKDVNNLKMGSVSASVGPEEKETASKDNAANCKVIIGTSSRSSSYEDNKELDEIERSKIGIMRALVQAQDPSSSKDLEDDLMIRRFLRARELDIEKASAMLSKYLRWRREFIPGGSIDPSTIQDDLAQRKVFVQGVDKIGRPVVVAFAAQHKPTTLEQFKRYVTYTLEKIVSRMPAGQEKFVSIADIKGWGYTNSDIRGYIAALNILQDCYPERLAKLFIVNVPYIFMTAWKVVYPFIDAKTRNKIFFVQEKKLKSTLLAHIDETQIPDIYGGKLPLVHIQDC